MARLLRNAALAGLHVVRRFLPASLRANIRSMMFEWLDLHFPLPSGIVVRVGNFGDWSVYNEIFVRREYDDALTAAIDGAGETMRLLDLGANTGYFTLRAADLLRRRARPGRLAATAVEADARAAGVFRERVLKENALADEVTLVEALVGEKSGSARFFADRIVGDGNDGLRLPFVDLESLLPPEGEIDLLKCDIEGAELRFLEAYPGLLRRVRVAVFELHRPWCDTDRCRTLLSEAGLTRQKTFREADPCFIVTASR